MRVRCMHCEGIIEGDTTEALAKNIRGHVKSVCQKPMALGVVA